MGLNSTAHLGQSLRYCLSWMVLIGSMTFSYAQEKCGTVPYMEMLRKNGVIKQSREEFEQWLHRKMETATYSVQKTKAGPYVIPVVVHIIHNGEPVGVGTNLSEAQILSQILVLNNDFQRLNADKTNTPAEFLPLASSMDIQFVLAKQSPEGLPTKGIVRKQGSQPSWNLLQSGGDGFKYESYWPAEDYLNIWVINSGNNVLGYAQLPVSNLPGLAGQSTGDQYTDGVAVDYTVFGSEDGGSFNLDPLYNKGRTTTHEVGHFFGLRHIWGDSPGCGTDDYVTDTPLQDLSYIDECPATPQISCSTSDMYMNYMDYTNDACLNMFSAGQVSRMMIILDDPSVPRRNSLLTSHGLDEPVCAPDAPVDVAIEAIANPGPVTCNNTPELIVTVSNQACPIVTELKITYTVNGKAFSKTISGLSISALESDSISLGAIVLPEGNSNIAFHVDEVNGLPDTDPTNSDTIYYMVRNSDKEPIPLRKDFEDNMLAPWSAVNPANGTNWGLYSSFGTHYARFPSPDGSFGENSWLASPVLDFSMAAEASLFFDVSYTWSQQKDDRLRVFISENCGDTYTPTTIDLEGDVLSASNGRIYLDLSSYAGQDNLRVAFVATNATGDNINVDNIEFFVSSDPNPPVIETPYLLHYDFALNPSITFNLSDRQDIRLVLFDIMGRKVHDSSLLNVLNQTYSIELGNFTPGVYIFRIQIGQQLYTEKALLRR